MPEYPAQHDADSDWHRDNVAASLSARTALEQAVQRRRGGFVTRDTYLPRHDDGQHALNARRAVGYDASAALHARRNLGVHVRERAAARAGRFVGPAPSYTGEHHVPGAVFDLDGYVLGLLH